MITIDLPLDGRDVNRLRVGDRVHLNGKIFTARDRAHRFLVDDDFGPLHGGTIYHCGPIVRDNAVIAAGPTTSSRMNPYTPEVIKKYGIRAIIGKGGMDAGVLEALKGSCVYFAALGGCAVLYGRLIEVAGVHKQEFGMAEALWEFDVRDFPVVVAMDAHGNSIYDDILTISEKKYLELLKK